MARVDVEEIRAEAQDVSIVRWNWVGVQYLYDVGGAYSGAYDTWEGFENNSTINAGTSGTVTTTTANAITGKYSGIPDWQALESYFYLGVPTGKYYFYAKMKWSNLGTSSTSVIMGGRELGSASKMWRLWLEDNGALQIELFDAAEGNSQFSGDLTNSSMPNTGQTYEVEGWFIPSNVNSKGEVGITIDGGVEDTFEHPTHASGNCDRHCIGNFHKTTNVSGKVGVIDDLVTGDDTEYLDSHVVEMLTDGAAPPLTVDGEGGQTAAILVDDGGGSVNRYLAVDGRDPELTYLTNEDGEVVPNSYYTATVPNNATATVREVNVEVNWQHLRATGFNDSTRMHVKDGANTDITNLANPGGTAFVKFNKTYTKRLDDSSAWTLVALEALEVGFGYRTYLGVAAGHKDPTSDVLKTNWTGDSDNVDLYKNVNEAGGGDDGEIVYSSTDGAIFVIGVPGWADPGDAHVKLVIVHARAKMASGAGKLDGVIRIGGNNYLLSDPKTLTSSHAAYSWQFFVDPSDSEHWAWGDVSGGLSVGVKFIEVGVVTRRIFIT